MLNVQRKTGCEFWFLKNEDDESPTGNEIDVRLLYNRRAASNINKINCAIWQPTGNLVLFVANSLVAYYHLKPQFL